MIDSYFLYIVKLYSKNLLSVLFGITVTIVLIDYLQHAATKIESGNQLTLYLFYTWEFRLSQFYPLAIVFAAVITYMKLVGSNILVSLLSFGYTRKQLFIPFITPVTIVYILLIFLHMGEFSYAREKAWAILHNKQDDRLVNDLFFKYNDAFVYVKELDPIKKTLKEVTVFELNNSRVEAAVTMGNATFDGEFWLTKSAIKHSKNYASNKTLNGFRIESLSQYKFLKNYRPKVIELIYEGNSLSLIDAVQTYQVLKGQALDSSKIRASFYGKSILPLFVFFVLIILFFKTEYHDRYINKELVWTLSLGGTMALWGLLYALNSLSSAGVILPEIAIVLPVFFLLVYAVYILLSKEEKLS